MATNSRRKYVSILRRPSCGLVLQQTPVIQMIRPPTNESVIHAVPVSLVQTAFVIAETDLTTKLQLGNATQTFMGYSDLGGKCPPCDGQQNSFILVSNGVNYALTNNVKYVVASEERTESADSLKEKRGEKGILSSILKKNSRNLSVDKKGDKLNANEVSLNNMKYVVTTSEGRTESVDLLNGTRKESLLSSILRKNKCYLSVDKKEDKLSVNDEVLLNNVKYVVTSEKRAESSDSLNKTGEEKSILSSILKKNNHNLSVDKKGNMFHSDEVSKNDVATNEGRTESVDSLKEIRKKIKVLSSILEKNKFNLPVYKKGDQLNADVEVLLNVEKQMNKRKVSEKVHKCETCSEVFLDSTHLNAHMKSHTAERPFKCSHCTKTFADEQSLKQHVPTNTERRIYRCECCPKSFSKFAHLRKHVKRHTREKPPFECYLCSQSFTTEKRLEKHIQFSHIDTDSERFECEICLKSYPRKYYLNIHKRIHTGERPYFCDVCGKPFARKESVKQHSRTHTGEKPYSCEICGKSFSQTSAVRYHHQYLHERKPYWCKVCSTSFMKESSFLEHDCSNAKEFFPCESCSKVFRYYSSYLSHVKNKHQEENSM